MTIVILESDDKQTILRGSAARQWMDARRFLFQKKVTLLFPGGRRYPALVTAAEDWTLALVLATEKVPDVLLELAFEQAFEAVGREEARKHGRS